MVNTKIRLIIFFAAKNGEALYSQQKQDRELAVFQIMNSLCKERKVSCTVVSDSVIPWTAACPTPLSMEDVLLLFVHSRQEYCSGLPFPSSRDLPNPGIKPRSPALWQILFPAEALGKHRHNLRSCLHWRLEPGPSACKSDILTTTLWNHELFRVKLKKVGKTTRPFRYDLNQISYDYTVEVRNRFKGLDLIDRVPEEL